jgi:hypothetical protein
MKKLLFSVLLLSLALAACGGGSDSSGPVDAAKNLVKALEKLDMEESNKYLCKAQQADMDELGLDELEAMGIDPDELMDAFMIETSDMEYKEKDKDDDRATVSISGKIEMEFDTDKLKEVFKKMAEAEGQEVSDEELDMIVGMVAGMGSQEVEFEQDVEVIKEDGNWVVCDELNMLDELDMGF